MRKITPFLWFDDAADEAVRFCVSVFRNSRIRNVARYSEASAAASGRYSGSVMTVSFTLNGQELTALKGGPQFAFTPAISLLVNCDTQREIDRLWERLSAGGEQEVCGWLRDRYGVTWQIVPSTLSRMVQSKNPERVQRVMQAVLSMKKLDIREVRRAYGMR